MSSSQSIGRKAGWIWAGALVMTLGLGLGFAPAPCAADSPPATLDGLQLRSSTANGVIYVKPGASFRKYDKIAILDCFVQFDQNWQSNYNSGQVDPSAMVGTADMNRIKAQLAAEFKKVFTRELQVNGSFQIVDTAGPDVLVLRPAIINLRVTAPDIMTPGISMTVVRSAGSATAYLELWDSTTNTLLARALNAQADPGMGGMAANSVSNGMAADMILKGWADKLRTRLDAARQLPASP